MANCSEGVAGHPVKGPWPPLWPPPEEVAKGVAKGWPMLVGVVDLHIYQPSVNFFINVAGNFKSDHS